MLIALGTLSQRWHAVCFQGSWMWQWCRMRRMGEKEELMEQEEKDEMDNKEDRKEERE